MNIEPELSIDFLSSTEPSGSFPLLSHFQSTKCRQKVTKLATLRLAQRDKTNKQTKTKRKVQAKQQQGETNRKSIQDKFPLIDPFSRPLTRPSKDAVRPCKFSVHPSVNSHVEFIHFLSINLITHALVFSSCPCQHKLLTPCVCPFPLPYIHHFKLFYIYRLTCGSCPFLLPSIRRCVAAATAAATPPAAPSPICCCNCRICRRR